MDCNYRNNKIGPEIPKLQKAFRANLSAAIVSALKP